MSDNTIRLAKRVAEMIPCSRGEAEQYIAGGWISVDGEVVEEAGARVADEQEVVLDPDAKLGEIVPVTIMLHKPAGLDTSGAETLALLTKENMVPADHGKAQRFLKRHLSNLKLSTPLDGRAAGLVVFSQDFRINRKLLDDSDKVEQEYIVEVSGKINEGGLALLNHGLSYNGKLIPPLKASWQNETRLRFALKGVRPGQINHMCREVGLKPVSIKRIRVGRIPMASLPVGQWRYLYDYEKF